VEFYKKIKIKIVKMVKVIIIVIIKIIVKETQVLKRIKRENMKKISHKKMNMKFRQI
jgi:hypothetical protein